VTRTATRLAALLLAAALPTVEASAAGPPAAGPLGADAEEIELGFFNGVYDDLDSGLRPVRQGPLVIRFSSPEHRFEVHANRLALRPVPDAEDADDGEGTVFDARVEVDFEGEGVLIADVEGAGVTRRLVDAVTAPRQTAVVQGRVRIGRTAGGYRITLVEIEPTVGVEIRSAVAGQIVDLCRALAVLPLVDLGCASLERALRVVRAPLPEPGTELFLPEGFLDADERSFFERLAPPPPSP
jgi:hypothetical protein